MRKRGLLPYMGAAMLAAQLLACVPVPEGMLPPDERPTTLTSGVFRGLDPGHKEESGLHFKIKAYGSQRPAQILQMAETQYTRIMNDTGLFSWQPRGLYEIVVYSNADEFHKKTQFAPWAMALTAGNAIYAYDGPALPAAISHEMTHLIFHEYMAGTRAELRWVNEGLAMYQESRASGGAPVAMPPGQEPLPFSQMAGLVPATERERQVHLWYRQVGDVVGFMIERGGRIGFGQFMAALRDRRSMDDAIRSGFPGVWNSMRELEDAWRRKVNDALR